ncbi:MAG: CaiB/BaiF CoA transferase family protein [Bradymonadaceae bacterium]
MREETTVEEKPYLSGLKVLDLSRLLPGPFCTLLLADMGAEVIKVEDPRGGDYARYYPPHVGDVGAFFGALNRNKRSITLNLKHERGVELLGRLAKSADVVIESFRPGVMDRLGVGYEALKARNPALVYCAISGYGADGTMQDRAGHDLNYMARCGLLDLNGRPDQKPVVAGFQLADIAGGALYAALGIVSALYRREQTGTGGFLDISMTEGALSFALPSLATLGVGQAVVRGEGMLGGGIPSYDVYETADGRYLSVAPLEPKFWTAFVEVIGMPGLVADGLATGEAGELAKQKVAEILRQKSLVEWVEIFGAVDVCVEPVSTIEEVLEDELFKARKIFFELGGIQQARTPLTPRTLEHTPAPALGEHTDDVLMALGLSELDIAELRSGGIL